MSEFLTQSELSSRLEKKTGINPETAKKFSSTFFSIVEKGLKNANTFSVYNFGTFKKTWIESSIGLNPQTGVKIEIPAHWRIKFVPCASVAKRVNKKYANLKAKVIKSPKSADEKVSPNGLYAKASKLEEESKDETVSASAFTIIDEKIYESENGKEIIEEEKISVVPENQDEEIPESVNPDEIEDEDDEIENEIDENDEDEIADSEKKSKKPVILVLLGAAIIAIVLLIMILAKTCSSKNSLKEKKPLEDEKELHIEEIEETISENEESSENAEDETSLEEKATSENENILENAESSESTENETSESENILEGETDFENAETSQSEELFESYVVKAGGCYNKIAEEKYKNRHLWPLIYSANKSKNVDPDFISSSASLKIPELPSNQEERNAKIAQAVLDAYNAYLLMCEKQPESTKNEMRRARAVRVLVSGEIVYPGFIDSYSSRILPEYAESAKNIVKNQYKM